MPLKNIIDLTDGVILRFLCFADDSRLDINITIGIICRLAISVLLILFRDINEFTTGEFIVWFFIWLVQHTYLMTFELSYIWVGESKVLKREILNKIMGSVQLFIAIIFLALNLKSYVEIIILTLFSINFLLNVFFIYQKSQIHAGYIENYVKVGGNFQCYIGFFIGALGALLLLLKYGLGNLNLIKDETYIYFIYFAVVGQPVLLVQSMIMFYRHYSNFIWCKDWAKGILGFFCGIKIGIFSVVYGFIIGVILFMWFLWECYLKEKCVDQEKEKEKEKKRKQKERQYTWQTTNQRQENLELAQIPNQRQQSEAIGQITNNRQESDGIDQL